MVLLKQWHGETGIPLVPGEAGNSSNAQVLGRWIFEGGLGEGASGWFGGWYDDRLNIEKKDEKKTLNT